MGYKDKKYQECKYCGNDKFYVYRLVSEDCGTYEECTECYRTQ